MWIFSKYGFFSVTQHAKRRDNIQIRARTEQDLIDLKQAFPMLDRSPIIETKDADYQWRLVIARWKWEAVAAKLTADIDYGNFKGKMATIPTQRNKMDLLHAVWHLHHDYQRRRHPRDPHAGQPRLFREAGDPLIDLDDDQPDDPDRQAEDEWHARMQLEDIEAAEAEAQTAEEEE